MKASLFVLVLCSAACISLPAEYPDRQDAIGFVSVSAPHFTPLNEASQGDRRLQFGDLRKESNLAEALQTPAFSVSRIDYSMLEMLLAARIAGAQLDSTETVTETSPTPEPADAGSDASSDDADSIADGDSGADKPSGIDRTVSRERTRSFKSPALPGLPGAPAIPAEVMTELVNLLKGTGTTFRLPPDVLATLVAANKMYMVNLEEYFNVEGFDFSRGLEAEYVPYKVHLTVTAEPGWYTRHYRHDAVVEIEFGAGGVPKPGTDPDGKAPAIAGVVADDPEYIVLSVTPAETAETINEFAAALNQIAIALSIEGTFPRAALNSQFKRLQASAERLEGIRAGKTLTVGFPAHNKARIRFVAATTAEQKRDLQITSRVLTALVLVKNRKDESALAIRSIWKEGREAQGEKTLRKLNEARDAEQQALKDALDLLDHFQRGLRESTTDEAALRRNESKLESWRSLIISSPSEAVRKLEELKPDPAAPESGPDNSERLEAKGLGAGPEDAQPARRERREDRGIQASAVEFAAGARGAQAALFGRFRERADAKLAVDRLAAVVRALQDSFAGRRCDYRVTGWFAPSVWGSDGTWSPPRGGFLAARDSRLSVPPRPFEPSWIPPWMGPIRKKLIIEEAYGYYHAPLAALAAAETGRAEKKADLEESEAALEKQKGALAAAENKVGIAAARRALDTAKNTEKELRTRLDAEKDPGKHEVLEQQLARQVKATADLADVLAEKENSVAGARNRANAQTEEVVAAREALAAAELRLQEARHESLGTGTAIIGLRVDAPDRHLESRFELYERLRVWVRVRAATGDKTAFQKIGSGPCSAVLEIGNLDLGLAIPPAANAGNLKPIGVMLDVVLMRSGLAPEDGDPLQRQVARVILNPSVGASLPSGPPHRAHPAPAPTVMSKGAPPLTQKVELD